MSVDATSDPILITGAAGQVGWELQRALAPLGALVAADRATCDVADAESALGFLDEHKPGIVVNAAAFTDVDGAESAADAAHAVNARWPEALSAWAASDGAWVIHYSTDYVFDGSGDAPWQENDPAGPLSVYGHTKLAGERAICDSGAKAVVLRTSWVFGFHGKSFLKSILKAAAKHTELRVVADQFGVPTPAHLLADVTAHILRDAMAGTVDPVPQLYHVAPRGATTWHDYAQLAIERARALGAPLAAQELVPIPTDEWPTAAPRPRNSRLDCTRLESAFGLRLPDWESGVRRVTESLLTQELPL